jgi:hypothetical protein
MTKQEIFHRQLVASVVHNLASTPYEAFMVRSELIRRTREFVGNMGPDGPQYARASTTIFFNGDSKAYEEHLETAAPNQNHIYALELFGGGLTTIKAISS